MADSVMNTIGMHPKAQVLLRLMGNAKKAKERFDRVRNEIERYDYGDLTNQEEYQNWDGQLSFHAKVFKTQQYKREIGSRLYNNNPAYRLEPRKFADEIGKARTQVMEDYLNYTTGENGMFSNMRGLLDDALGAGRGVMWYGLHPQKDGVVTAVQDTVGNLYVDPDATRESQIKWIARRRFKPKWELAKDYPDKKGSIAQAKSSGRPSDENYEGAEAMTTDLVEYYEVYMTVGLHHYKGGLNVDKRPDELSTVKDEPKKYVITRDGFLLFEGEWEVPFHLDGTWPCDWLDFYDHPKSIWPISPLEPGLGWQKAINWVSTMIVAKYQWSAKTILAMLRINGVEIDDEDKEKIESPSGSPLEVINVAINSYGEDTDIRKYMQQVQLTTDMNEALKLLDHLNSAFEHETGLWEFLYHGQAGAQDRSAAATHARNLNTKSRINDMQSRIEEFCSRVGRKMALTARYLLEPDDISVVLGPEAGQIWGFLFDQEKLSPDYWARRYIDDGQPVEQALMMANEMVMSGVSLEQWLYEIDYTVEIGSTIRNSPERESAAIQEAFNTVLPAAVQAGAFQTVAHLMTRYARDIGLGNEDIEVIQGEFGQLAQEQTIMRQQAMMAPPAGPGGAPGAGGPPPLPAPAPM